MGGLDDLENKKDMLEHLTRTKKQNAALAWCVVYVEWYCTCCVDGVLCVWCDCVVEYMGVGRTYNIENMEGHLDPTIAPVVINRGYSCCGLCATAGRLKSVVEGGNQLKRFLKLRN